MSINLEPRTAKVSTTRLLYCAYDGRVTRHTLRGVENALVCVECGHRIGLTDAGSTPSPHAGPAGATVPLVAALSRPHERRGAVRTRRGARPRGIVALVAVSIVIGTVGLAYAMRTPQLPEAIVAPVAAAVPTESGAGKPVDVSPVRVANTEGQGAYVRRTTNLEDRLRAWEDGTVLNVTGPDVMVDGMSWKPVVDPAGNRGWIPSKYTGT